MGSRALTDERVETPDEERPALARLHHLLEQQPAGSGRLIGADGREIEVPSSALRALERAARLLAEAEAILLVPVDRELTIPQAARLLNMPPFYLVQLLDE